MANYLLLRNNKESGPYSVDDLMELGLKPYDLVWIQGKSAAWRYPSEVDELKPIAPVVEEQPFDRFFKRAADTKKESFTAVEEPPKQKEETLKQEIPVVQPQYEKYIPKKSVFVAMPGQKSTVVQSVKREEPVSIPAPVQQTITISENPAAAQIKYSQPLDEIKEMYVKTLQDRKQKIARKSIWLKRAKQTAALLSLVAVGVIAGFVIKSNNGKQAIAAQTNNATQQQQQVTSAPVINVADDTILANHLAASSNDIPLLQQPSEPSVNKIPERKDKPIELKQSPDKPLTGNLKNEIASTSSSENKISNSVPAQPKPVDIDPATGERSRKVRTANEENSNHSNTNSGTSEKKSFLPDNIVSRQVSVKSNAYKVVAFGGIRGLELTVTNDSKYVLDNVTVELQYIKPNELPLRTENIQFTSVGPNATSTIRVPDTNRGIKVTYRIVNIKSRQMDEGVAGN
jgi:hypothetical protein